MTRHFEADQVPFGGYRTILADPPWKFITWSKKGLGKSPDQHYETMTFEDICDLPIQFVGADDCALFMWCTWPTIFMAEKVASAWGFKYSGLAWEWIKYNADTGKFAFGNGYGTRKNVEPCLLFRRGHPQKHDTKAARSVRDFMMEKRREHSRKPDKQYYLIETLFPGPYLELFGRCPREGWDSWGNETTKFQPLS